VRVVVAPEQVLEPGALRAEPDPGERTQVVVERIDEDPERQLVLELGGASDQLLGGLLHWPWAEHTRPATNAGRPAGAGLPFA
jgi:hypothetical protein